MVALCAPVVMEAAPVVGDGSVSDATFVAVAQGCEVDTSMMNLRVIPADAIPLTSSERFFRNKYVQMTYIGVPLVITGVLMHPTGDLHFKDLRDAYVPDFRHTYDDYLQYTPGLAMLIMKACGVKGRTKWGRMLVSDAFSAALVAGIVNGLKYSVGTLRPDGSKYNSFPSGHTAVAFAAATMLHKEYGHISPWISIGGYAVATATGISRMLNNRHWMSDVLAGAGIGIMSVEFGYLFADLIFKDKGIETFIEPNFDVPLCPSGLALTTSLLLPLNTISLPTGATITPHTGSMMGVSGMWYGSPYWGIGGEATVASMPLDGGDALPELSSFDNFSFSVAAAGRFPFLGRCDVSLRALLGAEYYPHTTLLADRVTLSNVGFSYGIEPSFGVVASRNFGIRIFCHYKGATLPMQVDGMQHNAMLHNVAIGFDTSILF